MRWLLRTCLVALFALASALPSGAATAVFYSKADNSYGWCAGYSYGRSESCARQQCLDYGSGCELAVECDGGWSATAFAYDPVAGFGASCQWNSPGTARSIALTSCIYASRVLCYTSETFNGSGSTTSTKSNESYDTAWYTQQLLLRLGYDIGEADGEVGAKTREAIREVEAAMGLEPTGKASWDLINVLLYVYGGTSRLANAMIAETDAVDQDTVRTYTYRYSSEAAADVTLGAELAMMNEPARLRALAAILNYSQFRCALPARAAAQDGNDPDTWRVACAEGNFTVSAGARMLVAADNGVGTDCPAVEDPQAPPATGSNRRAEVQGGRTSTVTADITEDPVVEKPSSLTLGGAAPTAGELDPIPSKPSPLSKNEPAGGDAPEVMKPSLLTENSRGPAPADAPCPPAGDDPEPEPFKPSGVTVNAPNPGLTLNADPGKPSGLTENAPNPNLAN